MHDPWTETKVGITGGNGGYWGGGGQMGQIGTTVRPSSIKYIF